MRDVVVVATNKQTDEETYVFYWLFMVPEGQSMKNDALGTMVGGC